jgi:single-strand DNA-binding protein
MAALTLATTEREIRKQDGTVIPERTEWHNITVFGNTADFVKQYIHKGAQLFVQGSIHQRKFDKQDGTKGYITEITADTVQLLDRKPSNAMSPMQQQNNIQQQQQPYGMNASPMYQQMYQQPPMMYPQQPPMQQQGNNGSNNDELPF